MPEAMTIEQLTSLVQEAVTLAGLYMDGLTTSEMVLYSKAYLEVLDYQCFIRVMNGTVILSF